MIKLDSSQGHQDDSTYENQSMWYLYQQKKKQKPRDHL